MKSPFWVLVLMVFCIAECSGEDASPIKHIVTLMLENRAFDHMLGYLKTLNPQINGLTGRESNPKNPMDPNSKTVRVSFDAPHQTIWNCGHSVKQTMIELWGSTKRVDPAPMNGFYWMEAQIDGEENGHVALQCFNTTSLPMLSTLAMEYTLFDSYHASVPGPTGPNRMYALSGTSHGACENDSGPEIRGYPQRTFFEDVGESGKDWKIYYGDFPVALELSRLREYPSHFHTMYGFVDDCASGKLPAYSFIEPRWFDFLGWKENSQHPGQIKFMRSGDVRYGEMLIKEVYEAVRSSPAWNSTLLIITYDEHGGLYDHVAPPQHGVPNPDNMTCDYFDFTRLGIRVPTVLISPWVKKGGLIQQPAVSYYDHTSILGTARKLLNLKQGPLTAREAWSATFEQYIEKNIRSDEDCLKELSVPETDTEMWADYQKMQQTPETPQNVQHFSQFEYETSKMPLSDWQEEIIRVAHGSALDATMRLDDLTTVHDGAVFVRQQMSKFLKNSRK